MGKLFSRSSKSSDAKSDNPYAQSPVSQDPYSDNSSKTSMSSFSNKSASGLPSGPRAGLPSGPRGGAPLRPGPSQSPPSQQPPPSYGSSVYNSSVSGSVSGGYAPNKFGSGGGYGSNRYQNEQNFQQNQNAPVTSQPFRPGGYGGLGDTGVRPQPRGGFDRTDSTSTEAYRGDLFGGAKDRYEPQRGNVYDPATKPKTGYGQSGAPDVGAGSYGGYGEERELTEEEKQEQELDNTKNEISRVRDDTYQATNRTLQTMYSSLDVGQDTLARLGSQGESLRNAEKNMDMAKNYNLSGYEKARELQTVNRSMFAVHVSNPFTAKKRAQARDDAVMNRHREEKSEREATRAAHFSEARLVDNKMQGLRMGGNNEASYKTPPKSQNKFIFDEEDSDEERKEQAIDSNLGEMHFLATKMNELARDTGDVISNQNDVIERIAYKTDHVDDGVRRNRHELDKIR